MPAGRRDPIGAARTLHARGRAAMLHGRPRRAEPVLNRALALLDGANGAEGGGGSNGTAASDVAELRARVQITLANAEFELFGLDRALARLSAVQTADGPLPPALQLPLANQRGLFLLRVGRLREALGYFDAAVALPGKPSEARCGALLNRAVAHMDSGSLAAAGADLARCAEESRRAGLPALQAKATHNLGFLQFLRGNLPAALEAMDAAYRLDPTVNPGIALLGKAEVLVQAGLLGEADQTLAQAAAILGRERITQDLGEAELERARCALALGDAAAARRFASRARDRFRRRGNDRWRRAAELVLLQGDLAAGRPGSRLAAPAQRLRAEFEAAGERVPARTAALIAAEAWLSTGQAGAAAAALVGTSRPGRRDPIAARLHDGYVRARLSAAAGRRGDAARRLDRALGELAAYQAGFGSIDLSTAAAVHGRRLAELDIALALQAGRPDAVFAAAERTRAVANRLTPVVPPADPQRAELLSELRLALDSLRYAAAGSAEANRLVRRRAELERAISERGWTRGGTGSARPVASLDEVRHALVGQALVVYLESAGRLHALAIDDGARGVALGPAADVVELVRRVRADLDVLAQPHLPAALRDAVHGSYERSLRALDELLVEPLGLAGRAVVITATGVLGQLPWGALPSLRGTPVVVAPSATAWLSAARAPVTRRRFGVAALAGPDLERAGHEAAGVAACWGPAGARLPADRAGFTRALGRSTLVHVAAHGVHQMQNPLFSSLRLADGALFAHELDQSARTPEHVVLSACELGLATVRPGDEALGLTSVLLHLGTRSVIAGVARVGDELAERTMLDYHRRLAAGQDSAAALAGATEKSAVPFVCFGSSWQAPGFGTARRRRVR